MDKCLTCGKSFEGYLDRCVCLPAKTQIKVDKPAKTFYRTQLQHTNNNFKWRMRTKRKDI